VEDDVVAEVAAEQLVSSLAPEHHLDPVPGGEVAYEQLRERAGTGDGLVEMPEQAVEGAAQLVHGDLDLAAA
jgi:hypothetical protein